MIKAQIRKQLIHLIIIVILVMIIGYLNCKECFTFPFQWRNIRINLFINMLFFILLWKGNELLSMLSDRMVSWKKHPGYRALLGVSLMLSFTIPVSWGIVEFSKWLFDIDWENSLATVKFATIITIFINLVLIAAGFFKEWRNAAMSEERLKAEKVKIKYEALRNQVNPHFLFNSLNVLIGLIEEDKDKAIEYVENLSETFRYVLSQKEQDVVPLKEEIEFLLTYNSLLKIRFGEAFKFNNALQAKDEDYILALSTQLLLENAIKHNQLTIENPLIVDMYREGEYLVLENNLQVKKSIAAGNGIGLQNIQERLQMFDAGEMQILKTEDKFIVKVPILTKEQTKVR